MYNEKKILAIIPARGGSKGLPGKNIRPLLGKPLIGWTIEQAKSSKYIDEIFISTDCSIISKVAESFGVKVPELRPAELASDSASSASFVIYTLDKLKTEGKDFDYILLLEPTSPLRTNNDIDDSIELAINNPDYDGVVSLGEVHMEHPLIVKKVNRQTQKILPYIDNAQKINQRQEADLAFFPYGIVYLVKKDHFLKTKEFYGVNTIPYYVERWQCYEVDDVFDFVAIESILKYQKSISQ